jgi:hypothetical protein
MIVIGKTNGGYIVEITYQEARRMIGSSAELDCSTEYDIYKAFQTLDILRRLDESKINRAKTEAREILDELENLSNTVQALTLFDTLSTTEEN